MAIGDLTTIANVKQFLNVTASTDDTLLQRLVSMASRYIANVISRAEFPSVHVNEVYDGVSPAPKGTRLMLRNRPVVSVQSVSISYGSQLASNVIPQSPDGIQPGWIFDKYGLKLVGGMYNFNPGVGNITVSYTSGYQRINDAQYIPGAGPYTIASTILADFWLYDQGVTLTVGGTSLTAVTGVPASMQYAVDANGNYTFNAAQAGLGVTIAYGCCPRDLEQVVIDLCCLRYRERLRMGENSRSLGQEVMSYSTKDLSDNMKTALSQYQNVLPI
jgi:hypothetical protein